MEGHAAGAPPAGGEAPHDFERPRLLVSLPPRAPVAEAIAEGLPGVPWSYLGSSRSGTFADIEAMLVGSPEREFDGFDPASLPRLTFVQRLFTGLDEFPFGRFGPGVRIAGNVGGYAPFVAEHAVALALGAARATRSGHAMIAEGLLRPVPPQSSLRGRTAVILGYGSIGREIARRLEGFDVRRIGVDRVGRAAPGVERVYPAEELEGALAEGDVVFEARPLTRATRGSLNAARFARMPEEAIFVNVGRAGTVVEEDLFRHLEGHPRFRAALDVWWGERYGEGRLEQRLRWPELPNVLGTPHAAAILADAERYGLRLAVRNLRRYFDGGGPEHLADPADYAL